MTSLTPPCSDVAVEALPGTAKTGSTYVLFEWPGAWSRDVLDGGTFGEELTAKLKAHMERYNATLLLIRHSTREARQITDHHVYLVFADQGVTEVLHVDGPEDVLDLDLSGVGKNGAKLRTTPLLLICTHGKRDTCCAVKGRPLVNELRRGDEVWETSHIKGHRFAPTMMLMPWAFSFGHMSREATSAMLDHAEDGLFFVPGNRGRGTLTPPEQTAEIAVAAELSHQGIKVGIDQLQVRIDANGNDPTATVTVKNRDTGDEYEVKLRQKEIEGVVDSCGKAPKTGKGWVVETITPGR